MKHGLNSDETIEHIKAVKDDLPRECQGCGKQFESENPEHLRTWYIIPKPELACKSCKQQLPPHLQKIFEHRVYCFEMSCTQEFLQSMDELRQGMQEIHEMTAHLAGPNATVYETLEDIPMRERFANTKEKK